MNWQRKLRSNSTQLAVVVLSVAMVWADTKTPPRGVRECASCHPAQAKPQPQTSMAHAMELPAECVILKAYPLLVFQHDGYSYRIERKGDESLYTVSNANESLTVPLRWAFGLGEAGQTYVFEKDGTLYESRVSFYRAIGGLDLTMGAQNLKPHSLQEAAGRSIVEAEAPRCFGCHATNAVHGKELTLAHLTPGVQCERCHGPSEAHLTAVKSGVITPRAAMKDLGKLSTEDMSSFCGQCHRTWEEIASGGVLGVANVRFQPYRLTNSKCYDASDARIRCTACHDPHQEVDHVSKDYDAKCLACHGGGKAAAQRCPQATADCVSCHMPKIELPGAHFKFTDHEIRIVRANASYPN